MSRCPFQCFQYQVKVVVGNLLRFYFEASKKAQSIKNERNSVSRQFMLLQDSQIEDLKADIFKECSFYWITAKSLMLETGWWTSNLPCYWVRNIFRYRSVVSHSVSLEFLNGPAFSFFPHILDFFILCSMFCFFFCCPIWNWHQIKKYIQYVK